MSSTANGDATHPTGRQVSPSRKVFLHPVTDGDLTNANKMYGAEQQQQPEPQTEPGTRIDSTTSLDQALNVNIKVNRPVYSQQDFNVKYNYFSSSDNASSKSCGERFKDAIVRRCRPSTPCLKKALYTLFPFIGIMKDYSVRNDLLNDIIAGLTVGVMHVPQGMAYGMLTTLDPVYGLYVSFFPVICYFFFGTSKHISIGTFAVVTLMVGSAVQKSNCPQLAPPPPTVSSTTDSTGDFSAQSSTVFSSMFNETSSPASDSDEEFQCKLGVIMTLTFVVGIYQILMALFKLGFVTIYLSDPLTRALTMAAAVHVFTSQVRLVFGVSMGNYNGFLKLVYMYIEFFKNITKTNIASLVMALICIVIIYSVQRWVNPIVKKKIRMPVPTELLVIIFGTLISHLASFNVRYGMKIVGIIPTGIPAPKVPPLWRFGSVATDAIGIAIVAFTINISMAKLFAKKHSYKLDANQELLAYGVTNTACSFLNCFVSCASLSRSLVQEGAGGRTQVAGLVSCSLLLVVLLAIAPLFEDLPQCVLAAIVIVNLKGVLMQITDIHKLYKKRQFFDLATWLVTAIAVILTEVDYGLFIGVGFSLLTIVFRTQRPRASVLGRIPQTDLYEDIKAYPLAREIPGIKIFSFTSSLYYANAEFFTQRLYKKSGCNPEFVKLQRAKQQKRREEAEKKRQKEKRVVHKTFLRRRTLNITTEQDDRMFTDEVPPTVPVKVPVPTTVAVPQDVGVPDAGNSVDVDGTEEIKVDLRDIIIDCSSMMFIDTVGVSAIQQVIQDYKDIGVRVLLACCREPVFDQMNRAAVCKKGDHCVIYVGVHDAVLAAVGSHNALYQQLKRDINGPLGSVLNETMYADALAAEAEEHKANGTTAHHHSDEDKRDVTHRDITQRDITQRDITQAKL